MRSIMQKNTIGMLMAVLITSAVGLACSGLSDETGKANKLIDEGNAAITETGTLMNDAVGKMSTMTDPKQVSASVKIAPDVIRLFDQAEEKCKMAAAKFEEASNLKVDEKFKAYLVAKVKEFNKRAELIEALKAIPQIVIDAKGGEAVTTVKALEALKIKTNAAQEKAKSLSKESDDLAAESKRIQDENPAIFKK